MRRSPAIAPLLAAGALAAVLAACQREQAEPVAGVTHTPEAAVQAMAESLRANDLRQFSELALPPALRERVAMRWEQDRAARAAPSAEDRAEFAQTMRDLTAPDAEETLYAEVEPQLAQWENEFATQGPLVMGMLSGLANVAINRSETLGPAQKEHAAGIVGALSAWATEAPLFDRERARQAVAVTVDTARALDLETAEDVAALDFEQALGRGGTVAQGVRQTLAVYGLDLDATFASLETHVVDQTADTATVHVDYELAGHPLGFDMAMVEQDGRWYSREIIASAEQRLAEPVDGAPPETAADAEPDAAPAPATARAANAAGAGNG
ncbi:hypothetical protein [Coralloluteibacterium stylophorae]|uniref:Lipoprotein n=1 Tax=Coralloluteibacterium stylophorae TaxID=1776034 RepID=A0A8J7VU17_9GAMM|nr:hypothetical protein [Coralloluteibacterium stylophorae]MBS7457108.1 hypothetical protein [Coralloluteibacterium stylophorae]